MTQQIEKRLQSMLNKSYRYGVRIFTLTGYFVDEEKQKVYLHTNEKENHWDRPFESVNALLKEFLPVDNAPVVAGSASAAEVVLASSTNMFDQLQTILMDNIEKVQANPGYIPQATAVNNNVNSLINLNKMKIDLLKAAQRAKE